MKRKNLEIKCAALQAELENLKKHATQLEKKLEERSVKCPICLENVKCPMRICKHEHLFCAVCVSSLMHNRYGNYRLSYNITLNPRITYTFFSDREVYYARDRNEVIVLDKRLSCPLCKEVTTKIKNVTPTTLQVIDPSCSNGCPFCDEYCNLDELGTHIVLCPEALVLCKYCNNNVPLNLLSQHFKKDCMLPCQNCDYKGSIESFQSHLKHHLLSMRMTLAISKLMRNQLQSPTPHEETFKLFYDMMIKLAMTESFFSLSAEEHTIQILNNLDIAEIE